MPACTSGRVCTLLSAWLMAGLRVLCADAQASSAPALPLAELNREVWTTRQDLPHNSINAIATSPPGYMWFATWEGAVRYNGRQFKLFERGELTGLPDSGIRSLTALSDDGLLVAGARGGISLYRDGLWEALPVAASMVEHAIRDRHGQVWLATEGAGLWRYRRDATGHWITENFLPGASLRMLLEDPEQSRLWVAGAPGVLGLDLRQPQTEAFQPSGLPEGLVASLLREPDGALLVGGVSGAFRVRDGVASPLHPELMSSAISVMHRDPDGTLWLGTVEHGLLRLREGQVERLDTATGLPNNRVQALHRDAEGSLWVGTAGGLLRLRAAPFQSLTRQHGLTGDYVRTVLAHPDGTLFVGSSEGLDQVRADGVVSAVRDGDRPMRLSVLSMALAGDRQGVWIGTHTHGLLLWQRGEVLRAIGREQGLPTDEIRAILVDRSGHVWVGTAGGLSRIEFLESGLSLQHIEGLPGNFVIALHEDRWGRIWIGTGRGLALYDQDLKVLDIEPLEQAQYVFGFHEVDDRLWLATDRGLLMAELGDRDARPELRLLGRQHGLPVEKLFQVVDDRVGGLWLSSNRGILRVDAAAAAALARSGQGWVAVQVYTEADGMASAQANGGSNPAAALREGRIWFATAQGAAQVDPQRLDRIAEIAVPAVIEIFQVDAGFWPITPGQLARLPARTSRIALEFAGLGFVMPQRISYRTRLDGFDREWIDRGTQNIAEFTNLAPGRYRFRVQAAYPYGDWTGAEATLEFEIAPEFWQRPAFWALLALLGAGVAWLLLRLRFLQLQRQSEHLRREVQQRIQELRHQAEDFARQARADQLTGLANRRAFDEWMAREFVQRRSDGSGLALVLMDIDHFKRINDRHDHLAGDRVLVAVAEVLRCHTRSCDQAARWGGEEFTLCLADIDLEAARSICERIRAALADVRIADLDLEDGLTASFGVACSTQADSYPALLRLADRAMFRAKREGRDRIVAAAPD